MTEATTALSHSVSSRSHGGLASPRGLWTVTILLCTVILVPTGSYWANAARHNLAQSQRLGRVSTNANQVAELEARLPEWVLAPKPTASLAPQVSAVLASAGLPASTLASLTAESPPPPATGVAVRAHTRHATLVLNALTLPQVGSFLQAWRQKQPGWTVSQIDLSPDSVGPAPGPRNAAKPDTGGDLPLRAVITLETLSLERGGVR